MASADLDRAADGYPIYQLCYVMDRALGAKMSENVRNARIPNPVMLVPDAMQALQQFSRAADSTGVPPTTIALVTLRASQINGCGVCVDMHTKMMRQIGESEDRIAGVAAWRDMPYYSDAERAALRLAESVTRLADSSDPVPDAVWNEARGHFDEKALAGLLISLAGINAWNRLNVSTRQPAGMWKPQGGDWKAMTGELDRVRPPAR